MIELIIAISLVTLSYALQGNIGLNLADEGFLWNGVHRVGQGKIPMRDYKSYDPGRIYWSYFFSKCFGKGLLGLRKSLAVFQIIGLWAGLKTIAIITTDPVNLALYGFLAIWWMHPRHKIFEHSVSLVAIYVGTQLILNPNPLMYFLTGVFVGLAGVIGRNHGVYNFAGFTSIFAVLFLKGTIASPLAPYLIWITGIIVGYAPMLAMWFLIPGMFKRYWKEKVMIFKNRGSTNLPLPIPWPWRVIASEYNLREKLESFFLGIHLTLLPITYLAAVLVILFTPNPTTTPMLVASGILGCFYMHHAFSRADKSHLCQAIQPFLLVMFGLSSSTINPRYFFVIFLILALLGYFIVAPLTPLIQKRKNNKRFVKYKINGDNIWILKGQVQLIEHFKKIISTYSSEQENLFFAPYSPGLYPILNKTTPVRSDFMIFPESEAKQREMIDDLNSKNVKLAFVNNRSLDKNDDRKFSKTHEMVWKYLIDEFEQIKTHDLGKYWNVFHRSVSPNLTSRNN